MLTGTSGTACSVDVSTSGSFSVTVTHPASLTAGMSSYLHRLADNPSERCPPVNLIRGWGWAQAAGRGHHRTIACSAVAHSGRSDSPRCPQDAGHHERSHGQLRDLVVAPESLSACSRRRALAQTNAPLAARREETITACLGGVGGERTEPSLAGTGQRWATRPLRRTTPVGACARRNAPQLRPGSPALVPSVPERLIARPRLLGRRYRAEFRRDRPCHGEYAAGRCAQDVAVAT